ncbi:mediator of RNA polymerase II transcription subunit 15a-like isoform X2 [Vitis riparia]|uniref:mediator of RNA polymerase II transcription subunit 15a-like isoform X2 n=1 Tax=Vitis riparia TaxID=96939 RepID=UPI00155AE381|nr:mediator of RNA polymerase II transcription subunit 15a-like isoform X2 [Vitis riparia]
MDANNWRTQLLPDARERIVNRIMSTLVKNFPSSKQQALSEVKNIAVRFEEKIYNTATSQKDYLRRISVKMLSIHTAPQNTAANVSPSNSVDTDAISTDPASHSVHSEVLEQEQSPLAPLANQSLAHQEPLSQNLHSNIASYRAQSSISLSSVVPHMTSLTKIPKPNVVGQDVKLQSMSGILPSLVMKSVGQGVSSNNAANSWRQVQEQEDFSQPVTWRQFQNPQQFCCERQLQHQIPNQKFKQESITESAIQTPHAQQQQQQQQQTLLQPNQLLSSQQSVIQTSPIIDISVTQSAPCSGLPQSQQSSVQQQTKSALQQHPQSVVRQQQQPLQAPVIHHQRTVMEQPDGLVDQQAKHSFLQKLQLISGQQNNQSKQQQRQLVRLDPTSEKRHANLGDWQEEVYQKIKSMNDMYLPELIQIYKKFAARYQQLVSLPQQPMGDQSRKLKDVMSTLEFLIKFLQVPKSRISLAYKEKLEKVENRIIGILYSNGSRKPDSSVQQEELPMPDMHSLQSVRSQSQTPQVESDLQPMKLQSTVSSMQKNNVDNLHNDLISSLSEVATAQKNIMNPQLSGTKSKSQQLHAVKPLQQDSVGSPHIPVSAPQQSMNDTSLSQNSVNIPQHNTDPLRLNSSRLQQIHLKQQKEQQMADAKQMMKQFQQHETQQQLKKKEDIMQQQQPAQLGVHKMPQNTMNKEDELKVKQALDFAPGVLQHCSASQHLAYNQHQLKSRGSFVSLPQLLQPVSDQIPQSSPQIDQKNILVSSKKTETSLKVVDSLSNVPSPSTPFSQYPMLGDIGGQQATSLMGSATSLVISTPGISSSSLLEEPLQRLIELVKSMSDEALSASINDIESVVNLTDGTAGSLSGNGAGAAIGEDMSATTKVCLEARDFGNQDGTIGKMKVNRCITTAPLRILSGGISDRIKRFTDSETSDMELSVTFRMKKPKLEANHVLLEEIREINQRLVDTVVDLSDEDITGNAAIAATEGGEGTIVKCSFSTVVAYSNSKSHQASAKVMPILPLHLLVPTNYPSCSPMLLDRLPVDVSGQYEDLSEKAKLKLSTSLENILEPISLEQIARTWDDCARAVICEYAQQSGGGSFSTTYGTWENCLSAA